METSIVVDTSTPIPYLAKFWFSIYGPKCCQPIKLQDLKKEVNHEVYFWHADKYQGLLQVDTIILGVWNQGFTKYQNKEVSVSLQYLQKSMEGEVDFFACK